MGELSDDDNIGSRDIKSTVSSEVSTVWVEFDGEVTTSLGVAACKVSFIVWMLALASVCLVADDIWCSPNGYEGDVAEVGLTSSDEYSVRRFASSVGRFEWELSPLLLLLLLSNSAGRLEVRGAAWGRGGAVGVEQRLVLSCETRGHDDRNSGWRGTRRSSRNQQRAIHKLVLSLRKIPQDNEHILIKLIAF